MTLPARIDAAKAKTKSVVDHLLYLLKLHENNALVVYSSLLSSQIPTSHAANAFNVFRVACIRSSWCACAHYGTASSLRKRMCQQ